MGPFTHTHPFSGASPMTPFSRRQFLATAAATAAGMNPLTAALESEGLRSPLAFEPPKFKLGLVTYNVPANWDLPTLLKVCKEVGIAAVECRTTHKHGVEPTLSTDRRKDVKKQFADAGIVFWGCGSVCEFHSDNPTVVKQNIETCKQFVGLVQDIGGKGVKVRPNGVPKGADPQKTFEQIGYSLTECGKAAEDAGVEIWVEVHGAVTAVPKNAKAFMDACRSKAVGLTWNSNGTDVEKGTVKPAFELLKPWIKSCHINDLANDAKGTYPYRELFGLLKGINYDRYTLCEVGKSYDVAEGTQFLKDYKKLWEMLTA